jgi:quinol monooxygenase YgiN
MIRELAVIPIQSGREAEFEAIFTARRIRVLAEEPDTLRYDLFRSETQPGLYFVQESFATPEAREFHLRNSTDHLPMMACFGGEPIVHRLNPVAAGAD